MKKYRFQRRTDALDCVRRLNLQNWEIKRNEKDHYYYLILPDSVSLGDTPYAAQRVEVDIDEKF